MRIISLTLMVLLFGNLCLFGARTDQQYENFKTKKGNKTVQADYLKLPLKTIDGKETSLSAYKGKVIMIVNVASKCGHTPQYKGLEQLYEKYKDQGFVILGFPANNFGNQEPGTDQEILKFCTTTYSVTFPMMSKVNVAGEDKHPLFTYLTEKSKLPGAIKWNFSKFLLDRNGELVARFPSEVEPTNADLVAQIDKLLK